MTLELPPDVAYCLDSAVELGDITGDVRLYFTAIETAAVAWFDDLDKRMSEMSFAQAATERMLGWRSSAEPFVASAITWGGLSSIPWRVSEEARGIASDAVRAARENKAFDLVEAARAELPRLSRGWTDLAARAEADLTAIGRDRFLASRRHIDDLIAETNRRRRVQLEEVRAQMRAQGLLPPRDEKIGRRARKARRKPIQKAVGLLSQVIGRQQAHAWIKGEDFVVEGRRFNFRSRVERVSAVGHGAMNLTVTDKAHVELVDLCFYFRDMPAPDQLAALIFSVQAGEEDGIIETGNVIRVHADASASPAFAQLRAGAIAEQEEARRRPVPLRLPGADGRMIEIAVPETPEQDPRWPEFRRRASAALFDEIVSLPCMRTLSDDLAGMRLLAA